MPSCLIYLGVMLVVIIVWFSVVKRPVYEGVLLSFILLLAITGRWGDALGYVNDALSTSLLYSMVSFVAMSIILTKTKIIDSCIALILSLIGRVTGGAATRRWLQAHLWALFQAPVPATLWQRVQLPFPL